MDPFKPKGSAWISTELPPSRGQWQAIAQLACRLMHVTPPKNRLAATTLIVRMAMELEREGPTGPQR